MTNDYLDGEDPTFYDDFESMKAGAYEVIEDRLKQGSDLSRCHLMVRLHSGFGEEWGCLDAVANIDMVPYGSFEPVSLDFLNNAQESVAIVEYKFKKSDLYDAIYGDDVDLDV